MLDPVFAHPRLAAVYDALDPDRSDLEVYADLVTELGARRVLDVGCGTGTFALLLSRAGLEVTGLDPAAASLAVANAKPGASGVRWLLGDASVLPRLEADLATMTGNVAQAVVAPSDWHALLAGVRQAVRPGGHLVLETRDPTFRAWSQWHREATTRTAEVPGIGVVTSWTEVVDVSLPLVGIRTTWVFAEDGAVLTSDSTLRFRERDEVADALEYAGYVLLEVRDARDRPGRELVFVARVGRPRGAAGAGTTLASYDAVAARYVRHSAPPGPAVLAYLDAVVRAVGSGSVLEIGSGPGHDADHLERRGLRVLRTDGAPAFVARLEGAGHDARLLDVRVDDLGGPYEGVLANAVLLHLPREQLPRVLERLRRSVVPAGVLAFTVKEGDGQAWTTAKLGLPRHFTYWREPALREALCEAGWDVTSLEHVEGRQEGWLFVLARSMTKP